MTGTIRTVTILLPNDNDLSATLAASRALKQSLATLGFNDGEPLTAPALQRLAYHRVKGALSATMTCSAIRAVAGCYASVKSHGLTPSRPLTFTGRSALFLVGARGRDARLCGDGTLSIWTVAGRKRIPFRLPKGMRTRLTASSEVQSLTVTECNGVLVGRLAVTISCPEPAGTSPVGIDLNAGNALVAADADDRILFLSGKAVKVANKRDARRRKRLQKKLAQKKAQKANPRSVRRSLKRLGCKQRNRTRTFAQTAAKRLVNWAGQGSILVFEALHIPPVPKRLRGGRANRRKLSQWQRGLIHEYARCRAEEAGMPLVFVNPAYTSKDCSACGQRGHRKKHRFSCPHCGHLDHADINAARNIRDRYAVALRGGGPAPERYGSTLSPGPEASGASIGSGARC